MNTTIVLLPTSQKELDTAVQVIKNNYKFFIVTEEDAGLEIKPEYINEPKNTICVPKGSSFAQKANIARQLICPSTDILIFLSNANEVEITEEWVESRVKAFRIEKVIGIIGKLFSMDIDKQIKLEEKMLTNLIISPEEFAARCKLQDGALRLVDKNSFSTTTKVWDKIGGLALDSEDPVSEYCCRIQSLGYGLLPQPQ